MSPEKADILKKIADGRSYKEIASEVGTSEAVIKNVVSAMIHSNEARNRTHLVAKAFRKGVIS